MERTRVIVVDDDQVTRLMVRHILSQAGISCDLAGSAEESLAMMRDKSYAVAIVDFNMPGMNGIELLSALKQHSSLVQAIMLTGESSMTRVIECLDHGALDFFSKGDDPSLLVRTVKDALSRSDRWMNVLSAGTTRIGI